MPGGNRGMGCENHFTGDPRRSLLEAETLVFHAVVDRFQHGEAAVTFVQVQHAGGDSHRFESTETTDAQQ